MPVTTISSRLCQGAACQVAGQLARDERRAHDHDQHQPPGEHDGAIELEEPVLPEHHLIGAKAHGRPPLRAAGGAGARPAQPHHGEARGGKTREARQQPPPIAAGDEVEAASDVGHPQHQADENHSAGRGDGSALSHRPQQAAEEERAQEPPAPATSRRQRDHSRVIRLSSRIAPSSLATHARH